MPKSVKVNLSKFSPTKVGAWFLHYQLRNKVRSVVCFQYVINYRIKPIA